MQNLTLVATLGIPCSHCTLWIHLHSTYAQTTVKYLYTLPIWWDKECLMIYFHYKHTKCLLQLLSSYESGGLRKGVLAPSGGCFLRSLSLLTARLGRLPRRENVSVFRCGDILLNMFKMVFRCTAHYTTGTRRTVCGHGTQAGKWTVSVCHYVVIWMCILYNDDPCHMLVSFTVGK